MSKYANGRKWGHKHKRPRDRTPARRYQYKRLEWNGDPLLLLMFFCICYLVALYLA